MRLPVPEKYPVMLGELAVAVQVKVVPVTWERFWMLVVCAEQIVCAGGLKYTSGTWAVFTV